jgi:predicted transcriptional regulator
MSDKVKLTPVEWEIMEAIWELGGSPSVREVMDFAFPNNEKAYTTIQTIIKTLEKKGMLTSQKIGLVNFYQPRRSREEMVDSEMSRLVSRVFHGSIPAMANHLLRSGSLTLEEIEAMKTFLAEKEAELLKRKKS